MVDTRWLHPVFRDDDSTYIILPDVNIAFVATAAATTPGAAAAAVLLLLLLLPPPPLISTTTALDPSCSSYSCVAPDALSADPPLF